MLVTLARPELLDSRPSWGGGLTAYTALPLAPLSADEAHELANLRLGEIRTEAAMRLAETAEGNPLFIEQLAATVAESSPAGASLPSTIRGLLAARLDALPAAERALLLDAAVVGKTFWRGALPQIGGAADGLSELLGALERRDLIVRDRDGTLVFVEVRAAARRAAPASCACRRVLRREDRRGRRGGRRSRA